MKENIESMVIAGDQFLFRHGVRALLEATGDFLIVGEAETGMRAISLCVSRAADLLLASSELPDMDVMAMARALRRSRMTTRLIVISSDLNIENVVRVMRAGVSGYVSRALPGEELASVAKQVLRGKKYIPPEIADVVVARLLDSSKGQLSSLTGREYQVFKSFAGAKGIQEISKELGISPRTVESHKTRIMNKMGLKNIADLVRVAIREGVVNVK